MLFRQFGPFSSEVLCSRGSTILISLWYRRRRTLTWWTSFALLILVKLCNVVYKIISKILAARLKPPLHKLIYPLQAAFVPNRTIQENSILVHEIFHTMKKKQGRGGLMAIKIDMEKAYDKMSCPRPNGRAYFITLYPESDGMFWF